MVADLQGILRIISLCPSLTELVFHLGRGPDLVGITDYCIHPADGVAGIEKVGGTKSPAVARIVELEPDVVLLNEEENRKPDADALLAAGLHCINTFPKTVAQTATMVRRLGRALGAADVGEGLARDIEARSERVRREASARPAVRWAYLIWRKPWMTVNQDTYVDSLLRLVGGDNVFGALPERYPEIRVEDLVEADPEVVLLSSEPFPFASKHARELVRLTGISPTRFLLVDGENLSWFGSRTPAGIDYAKSCLHPERHLGVSHNDQ